MEKKTTAIIGVLGLLALIGIIAGVAIGVSGNTDDENNEPPFVSRVNFNNAENSVTEFIAACRGLQANKDDLGGNAIVHTCYGESDFKCGLLENSTNLFVLVDDCIDDDEVVGTCDCDRGVLHFTNDPDSSGCTISNSVPSCTVLDNPIIPVDQLIEANSAEFSGIDESILLNLLDRCMSNVDEEQFAACLDDKRSLECNSGSVIIIEDCSDVAQICNNTVGEVALGVDSLCATPPSI